MDPRTKELVRELQQNPLDPEAMRMVREHLAGRGKYGSLAKLLEWWSSRAASPDAIAEGYFAAGEAIERVGKVQRAIWFYARALKSSPVRFDACARLEEILGRSNEHLKLVEVLEDQAAALEAGAHDPNLRAETYTKLGHLRREKLNDLDGAVEALRLAVSAVPADRGAMEQLAIVLAIRGHMDRSPEGANDRRSAAELYTRIAKGLPHKQAIRHLSTALDHTPTHEPALALLEELLVGTAEEDLLTVRWRAFVDNAPDNPAADERRRQLARAYAASGKLAEATEILRPFAAKREITTERALSDIQEIRASTEPGGKPKRTAISDRLSAILSALDDDGIAGGNEEDQTGDFVIAPTTARRDMTRPRSDEEETRVASPGYPLAAPSASPYVLPPPTPAAASADLLDEDPTQIKLHPSAPDGATELSMPSFDELLAQEPLSRVRSDDTVPELSALEPEPETAELGISSLLPVTAVEAPPPAPRPAPRRERPAPESELPLQGLAPAMLVDDEDEDNPYLCDPNIAVETMVDEDSRNVGTDAGTDHKPLRPIVEVIRFRDGKVLDAKVLRGPLQKYGAKDWPIVVHKRMNAVSINVIEPGQGWLRRAGGHDEPLDAATSKLKLNEGDSAELRHEGIISRIRVVRPTPAPHDATSEVPVKLYSQCGGISFGVHLFFVIMLFAMNSMGISFRVEDRPPDEVFAEARLKAKSKPKKPKPKIKKPKPRRKERKLAPKHVADTQIRIPKRTRRLLKKIDKNRGEREGDRASKAVNALTSPYSGDGQTIGEVTTNIDAVKGGSQAGAFKVGGTLSALEGDGVNIASGGGGKIGTLGGSVATKDAGKLKGNRKGGKTRGKVRGIKALTKVQGNLSKGEVLAVINRNMGKIQRCYEKALNAKPNLSGKVEFEWTIKESGSVSGVRRAGSTLGEASVATCVAKILRGLKFPKPRGGPVTVKFPFMFQRVP